MCPNRQITFVVALCLWAILVAQSAAHAQNSKIDLSVRLRANDVTELHLSVDRDCVASLVGLAPVYEAASIDVLCVLKHGPAPSRSISRAIFQVHGYFPSAKAPDREKPFPITDEDRKVLDALGPDTEQTMGDYPMKGQVTTTYRMENVESKNAEGEFHWSSDTTWFKSTAIRSLPMECNTQWIRKNDAIAFVPRISKCSVLLNFHDINLLAILDLTAAITPEDLEFALKSFEEAAVHRDN
jgi:hypothetical protein